MADKASPLDADAISLDSLCELTASDFRQRWVREPRYVVAAPGRVNLIGEHTDYNGGFVLPMAIERYVVIAADPAEDGHERAMVRSANKNAEAEIAVQPPIAPGPVQWSSYVQGVVAGFVNRGLQPPPFDAAIRSTVPLGGGLSSSAALEVATATLLEALTGTVLEPVQKALLCQTAEHQYALMPCGIMDQFSSTLCQKDHLMLLDCRSQEPQLVPLADPNVTVLIANTNVKHELTGSEYPTRRAQCETAAKALGVETLRDATPEKLEAARGLLDPVVYRRARHVIGEIERTAQAAAALQAGRWAEVGRLMYASHDSLRDDYEVSCPELDLMVALAKQIDDAGGVIGSRMTGGGFGGCTVSLVKTSAAKQVSDTLRAQYQQQTGIEPTLFTSRPAQGARVLKK